MIGVIELLMIAIIAGIIYGRDAIDTTFRKSADEGVIESFAGDVKEYYHDDPKRLVKLVVLVLSVLGFLGLMFYWILTRTDLLKMLGWGQ